VPTALFVILFSTTVNKLPYILTLANADVNKCEFKINVRDSERKKIDLPGMKCALICLGDTVYGATGTVGRVPGGLLLDTPVQTTMSRPACLAK